MFSASLVSVLYHLTHPLREAEERVVHSHVRQAAEILRRAEPHYYHRVPVVAQSRRAEHLTELLDPKLERSEVAGEGGGEVVWGRVPLPTLVAYFQEYCEVSAKEEYIDLGTPLFADAAAAGSLMSKCENLLRTHPLGSAKVAVAIVDKGCRARPW